MFKDGFEKVSAARSEILNTVLNPINYTLGAPAVLVGVAVGKRSVEDAKKADNRSWSNLIPGVAPYRLGRRLAGVEHPAELKHRKTASAGRPAVKLFEILDYMKMR